MTVEQSNIRCSSNRRKSGKRGTRRGATAVEFCIAAPAFFYCIFATFEVSRIALIRNLMHDASYDAARYCIVEGATAAEATERANQILGLVGTRGATVVVNDGTVIDDQTAQVKVQVTVDLGRNSIILPWLFSGKTISSTSVLRAERYNGFYNSNSD